MSRTRQRQLAWMFTLVLALELALFCCACLHLADHACGGYEHCGICVCVRAGLRRVAVAAIACSMLSAVAALSVCARVSRRFAPADSPVLRRVRLND